MVKFVPFDPHIHMEEYVQLHIEHARNTSEQLKKNHQIDFLFIIGQTISEYVHAYLEKFTSLKPTHGVTNLLVVDSEVAGMGALRKLCDEVGEIKFMLIRPRYRGRGYGKYLLNRLLEIG